MIPARTASDAQLYLLGKDFVNFGSRPYMGPGGPGGPSVLQGNQYYQYVKDLSAGAFGFVQLARDRTNNEQANCEVRWIAFRSPLPD